MDIWSMVFLVALAIGAWKVWSNSGNLSCRVFMSDGVDIIDVEATHDRSKKTVKTNGKEFHGWSVPVGCKPLFVKRGIFGKRVPLFHAVIGEADVRFTKIPSMTKAQRETLAAAKEKPSDSDLSNEAKEEMKKLGINVSLPISSSFLTADGSFDNALFARIIEGGYRRDKIRPKKAATSGSIGNILLGVTFTLMAFNNLPKSIIDASWFGLLVFLAFIVSAVLVMKKEN